MTDTDPDLEPVPRQHINQTGLPTGILVVLAVMGLGTVIMGLAWAFS